MNRSCPVCQGLQKSVLYRQVFSLISDEFPIKYYDVAACMSCGFAFADDVPSQQQLDEYYKNLSKYENNVSLGKPSVAAMRNYERIVESVAPFLPDKKSFIADIGCATGGLLGAFQLHGYSNLMGVDPSPACAKTATVLYDIPVTVSSLFDVTKSLNQLDAVVFSSVMEHIIDLENAFSLVKGMLKDSGLVIIDVPDTVNFSNYLIAPFQQFSVEHVNFFTPISLANLLRRHGFEPVAMWHDVRKLGEILDPSLSVVARKSEKQPTTVHVDFESEIALKRYISSSTEKDELILARVDALVKGQKPIIIWGAGTQTQRLLASSDLSKARITAFVDSNTNYHGKVINGAPIIGPNQLGDHHESIVIVSLVYQKEITSMIRETLQLDNEIICLLSSEQ